MTERANFFENFNERLAIKDEWEYFFRALLHRQRSNGIEASKIITGQITRKKEGNLIDVIIVPMSYELGRPRFVTVDMHDKLAHLHGSAEVKWIGDAPFYQDSRHVGDLQFGKEISPILLPGMASGIVLPEELTMTHAFTNVDFFLPGTFKNIH